MKDSKHGVPAREVLTPEALSMLLKIAEAGSFASAARQMGIVPSALTYRVRQIEDALDVLLFDRKSRQAKLTQAGAELVREADRLLEDIDAVANRLKRIATGWEPKFTIAVDSIVNQSAVLELCEAFFELNPPTQLRIRTEILSGTLEALTSGQADLAIGVVADAVSVTGIQMKPLGHQRFVFAVAPHHPLAKAKEPLTDEIIVQHRIVAAADSVQRGTGISVGLLKGQNVFTVTTLDAKLQSQLRGLGCGFLPEAMARPYLETGRLVAKQVERKIHQIHTSYAWKKTAGNIQGKAMQWWLSQLEKPVTRAALMQMMPSISSLGRSLPAA